MSSRQWRSNESSALAFDRFAHTRIKVAPGYTTAISGQLQIEGVKDSGNALAVCGQLAIANGRQTRDAEIQNCFLSR
jgi:hypothetical protein